MSENPYQIYENEKGWNVLKCTHVNPNKLVLQRLSKGVAKHNAQLLNEAYEAGFNEARTLYDEKLFD